MNRLFEHELAAHCGVHHPIRIADPRRARRESNFRLRTKARPRTLLMRCVTRKQCGNQFARAIRESSDHATKVRKVFRSASRAFDFSGIETDVLRAAVRPFRIEESLFSLLECECELG